jgi:type VI secretion system protein ImpF
MAQVRKDQPLVSSVLDRLLDDQPGVSREPPPTRYQVLRQLKAAVRRDLENLLNTRVRCSIWPGHCQELKSSLVNYGIPDITGVALGSPQDREDFCLVMQNIIHLFEPRFLKVKVVPHKTETNDRTFRFSIDGLLRAEPAPEPIVFDTQLRPGTGDFTVEDVAG